MPPAFILSQDQSLHDIFVALEGFPFNALTFFEHSRSIIEGQGHVVKSSTSSIRPSLLQLNGFPKSGVLRHPLA
jgi:hypothetical protein